MRAAIRWLADARQYFLEMLDDKGQAKLDLSVEISGKDGPAVLFGGSYVVLPNGSIIATGILGVDLAVAS